MSASPRKLRVAIACGGTGGHLFPGLAVGQQLVDRGCAVTLLISPKEIDQCAVQSVRGMDVATLPAVGLQRGRRFAFVFASIRSYLKARKLFRADPPAAALAMGGFTSAPPILAACRLGAHTFLHESNTIPGRANQLLSRVVREAFVGFPSTAALLPRCKTTYTGTPVRPSFHPPLTPPASRNALGLDPNSPTVLVMGGSQGAAGLNRAVLKALPLIAREIPGTQWIHLAGSSAAPEVAQTYSRLGLRAVVHSFFDRMELAMNAADLALSRAGASTLAEIVAMRLPAILVPFPAAVDNHQYHNAQALVSTGAALLLEESTATAQNLASGVLSLLQDNSQRHAIRAALAEWHIPDAANRIAEVILAFASEPSAFPVSGSDLSAKHSSRAADNHRTISIATRIEPGGAA